MADIDINPFEDASGGNDRTESRPDKIFLFLW